MARENQRNAATMAPMDFFTTTSKGTKLAQAPDGVPSILSWTHRKDGMFCLVCRSRTVVRDDVPDGPGFACSHQLL